MITTNLAIYANGYIAHQTKQLLLNVGMLSAKTEALRLFADINT
jgi:hypothetical protein